MKWVLILAALTTPAAAASNPPNRWPIGDCRPSYGVLVAKKVHYDNRQACFGDMPAAGFRWTGKRFVRWPGHEHDYDAAAKLEQ
jgi:hypothetical protein